MIIFRSVVYEQFLRVFLEKNVVPPLDIRPKKTLIVKRLKLPHLGNQGLKIEHILSLQDSMRQDL
jgi:hypothetical protein